MGIIYAENSSVARVIIGNRGFHITTECIEIINIYVVQIPLHKQKYYLTNPNCGYRGSHGPRCNPRHVIHDILAVVTVALRKNHAYKVYNYAGPRYYSCAVHTHRK